MGAAEIRLCREAYGQSVDPAEDVADIADNLRERPESATYKLEDLRGKIAELATAVGELQKARRDHMRPTGRLTLSGEYERADESKLIRLWTRELAAREQSLHRYTAQTVLYLRVEARLARESQHS